MVSHAAWAEQVLYEAASAEKVGLMLDSGLLPGLEYVRVLTPSILEYGGAILCTVQRVGVGTGPFGCATGEARRVARRRCESRARADAAVRAGHAHKHTRAHAFAHAHASARFHTFTRAHAHTHMRAPTCAHT